jgi:hypothetical protein
MWQLKYFIDRQWEENLFSDFEQEKVVNAFNLSGFCYCLGNWKRLLMKCGALTHALGC